MRVVALLASYNEERFIGVCLEHLREQGIESYLIDNSSTDRTVEIASEYLGNGLINIETLPRPEGLNRLKVRLRRKDELAASINADWFMHLDPDEIRLPPRSDRTLAEALEDVDARGYNVVNFVEYTFIPTLESPEHDHPDFLNTMRWYYPFVRNFPHHLKAWKKQPRLVGLAETGGHKPRFPNMLLYPEPFKMRHYQFLSLDQARAQYLENNEFDRSTVTADYWRGWLVEERMGLPSESELNTYTSDDELSLAKPRLRHVMEDWALPEADRKEERRRRLAESKATRGDAPPGKVVTKSDELLVVYPQSGHDLYKEMGQRLVAARKENSRNGTLVSAAAVSEMKRNQLSGKTVAVLGPAQCYWGIPRKDELSLRLAEARSRLAVFPIPVETEFFGNQFNVPIEFDALVDVGFVSQEPKLVDFELPYVLLFNSPTREEKRRIEKAASYKREVPWAMVGHNNGGRVELSHELMQRFDPRGFVFLPQSGISVRKDRGMLDPRGLDALLRRTQYYVWNGQHKVTYYESLRFREAILAGAMPCKIEMEASLYRWEKSGIPGFFPSLDAFLDAAHNEGFEDQRDATVEWYFSHGLLADHLDEVLESV